MKSFYLFVLIGMCMACFNINQKAESGHNDIKEGKIIIKVCSRGCYQYVIESESEIYFPINLAEEYKILKEIPVYFAGTILESTTDIKKTSPTDKPVHDFTCQNVELSYIERKN